MTQDELEAKVNGFQAFIDDTEKRLTALEGAKTEPAGTVADHENVESIYKLLERHGIKPNPELDELEANAEADEPIEENSDDSALVSGTN